MLNEVTVLNIREYLAATENGRFGEEELKELLSEFPAVKETNHRAKKSQKLIQLLKVL